MAKKTFVINGEEHTVEMKTSLLSGSSQLIVDGKVVKALPRADRATKIMPAVEFEIAGKPAILQHHGGSWFNLYLDGEKVW